MTNYSKLNGSKHSTDLVLSPVGIAISNGIDDPGSISCRGKKFSLLHSVQTDTGANPASYPVGTEGSVPEDNAAGAWSWPHASI
jgi:hypothetical protein